MTGSLRRRRAGSWELTMDPGRDAFGRHRHKLRETPSILDRGIDLPTEKILLRNWLDRWMADAITPHR